MTITEISPTKSVSLSYPPETEAFLKSIGLELAQVPKWEEYTNTGKMESLWMSRTFNLLNLPKTQFLVNLDAVHHFGRFAGPHFKDPDGQYIDLESGAILAKYNKDIQGIIIYLNKVKDKDTTELFDIIRTAYLLLRHQTNADRTIICLRVDDDTSSDLFANLDYCYQRLHIMDQSYSRVIKKIPFLRKTCAVYTGKNIQRHLTLQRTWADMAVVGCVEMSPAEWEPIHDRLKQTRLFKCLNFKLVQELGGSVVGKETGDQSDSQTVPAGHVDGGSVKTQCGDSETHTVRFVV
jgi:hypothetical protein